MGKSEEGKELESAYKDWTKYHIVSCNNKWRFFREGMKRSIVV